MCVRRTPLTIITLQPSSVKSKGLTAPALKFTLGIRLNSSMTEWNSATSNLLHSGGTSKHKLCVVWGRDALVLQRLDRNACWLGNVKRARRRNEPDQAAGHQTDAWMAKGRLGEQHRLSCAEGSPVTGFAHPAYLQMDRCKIKKEDPVHLQSIRLHLNNESLIIIQKLIQGWRAAGWLNAEAEGFLRLAVHAGCEWDESNYFPLLQKTLNEQLSFKWAEGNYGITVKNISRSFRPNDQHRLVAKYANVTLTRNQMMWQPGRAFLEHRNE